MANSSRTPGNIKDKTESAVSSASQAASDVKNKASEAASTATQKAQEVASNVAGKAQELASSASEKTGEAMTSMGEKMTSLAGTIRERAPHEGTLGTAAATVADQLQAGGQYLQEHDLEDMAEDINALVRRYPLQSLFVGLGVGFLLGQVFSRR